MLEDRKGAHSAFDSVAGNDNKAGAPVTSTPTSAPMATPQTANTPTPSNYFNQMVSAAPQERVLILEGPITQELAINVRIHLMKMEAASADDPITILINSPGGLVSAGMAIYDTIQSLECPVRTYVTGTAASMGSILLAAGAPGERRAAPNARIMIHQPSGGSQGNATEMGISQNEIEHTYRRMAWVYAAHAFDAAKSPAFDKKVADKMADLQKTAPTSGGTWTPDTLKMTALAHLYHAVMKQDYFLYAEEAKDMGLIDKIEYPDMNIKPTMDPKRAKILHRIAEAERLANKHHRDNRPEPSAF